MHEKKMMQFARRVKHMTYKSTNFIRCTWRKLYTYRDVIAAHSYYHQFMAYKHTLSPTSGWPSLCIYVCMHAREWVGWTSAVYLTVDAMCRMQFWSWNMHFGWVLSGTNVFGNILLRMRVRNVKNNTNERESSGAHDSSIQIIKLDSYCCSHNI